MGGVIEFVDPKCGIQALGTVTFSSPSAKA